MAIFGTLQTLERQADPKKFGAALNFLKSYNLSSVFDNLSNGEKKIVEIDGKKVYAIFQKYDTKSLPQARLEGHRKYIDLQFIYKGIEQIGYADIADITGPTDYDPNNDIFFTTALRTSFISIAPSQAAIFTPDDLHAPCISTSPLPTPVCKIVIKIEA